MKLSRFLFAACAASVMLFTSACKSDTPPGDPELFKVENYLTPQKTVRDIKSAEMLYKVETDRDDDILVRIRYRSPNLFRVDFTVKNLNGVRSVQGPTRKDEKHFKGWTYDQLDGLKDLALEDVQKTLKESLRFPFRKNGLAYFFENSDKIGTGILNHEECWIFTCQPEPFKTEEQLCIWVGQQTRLFRLIEVGLEKVVHYFHYDDFGGLRLPRHTYESGMDGISKTTLLSAVWNPSIPLSVFLPPVTEKTIKLEDGRTFADAVLLEKTEETVTFTHKEGSVTFPVKDLPQALFKKIAEREEAALKQQADLEAQEAEAAKEEAEKIRKEEEKAKKQAEKDAKEGKKPVVKAPRVLSAGEKKQNEMRDAILKFQLTDLEKRLADQKRTGYRSPRPARYGFFTAGPHFFRELYAKYHARLVAEKKEAPAQGVKNLPVVEKLTPPAAEQPADKKAVPAAEKPAEKKAAPAAEKPAEKK